MDRQQLEDAIDGLDELLRSEALERDFQMWFETHDLVMRLFNYKRVIPHPQLPLIGNRYIPDFLCQRANGLWEVVELKRPDTGVLKDTSRRVTFYAELESYISQCCEYSEYFDDQANREAFKQAYGVEVQKRPKARLIAGRSSGLNHHRCTSYWPAGLLLWSS